jgi:glycosyltransferase involved in cell wall biosynthesis
MRIAQVAPLYESVPPRLYGGTELVVSYLTEELVNQGHDVTLFASGDSLAKARLIAGPPRSLRLDPNCCDALAHHILMLEKVSRLHEEDPFDVIHFHVDYLHFPISRREALPSLTTLHGRLDIPDLVALYREFREAPVVSISDAQRKPLPWLNWTGTVHHGLPPGHFRAYTGPGKYLAFLGRISPEKGVDHAIQIAQQSGMKLKIAAKIDRADREYYENKIKPLITGPNVEYLGEIGYPEKCDFLGNAAALLIPIQWPEPFGLVMIEAMACGTPIVAYPCGSVPEIVQDGINGYIVRNVQEAATAVGRLSSLNRLQCRRHFEKHFTAARMCRDYLAIYEHLQTEPAALLLSDGAQKWTKPA